MDSANAPDPTGSWAPERRDAQSSTRSITATLLARLFAPLLKKLGERLLDIATDHRAAWPVGESMHNRLVTPVDDAPPLTWLGAPNARTNREDDATQGDTQQSSTTSQNRVARTEPASTTEI